MTGSGFPPHSTIELDNPPGASPASGAPGFDPRESFYPTTLLKAEDVRVTMPRVKVKPRGTRLVKVLVAMVLALSAALAYVLFSKPPETASRELGRPPAPEGKPSAAGAIVPPAASIVQPAVIDNAKATSQLQAAPASNIVKVAPAPATAPAPALASPPAPAPAPRSVPVRQAAPPAPASAAAFVAAPAGSRAVTHTKASADATEAQKAAPPHASAAPAVVAAPPPSAPSAAPARSANCSDALAALGLCAPAK